MPLSNPYGCHMNALTGPAKNMALSQRNGRLLKVLTIDHDFLAQWRTNNPGGVVIYRRWFGDNNLDSWQGKCIELISDLKGNLDVVDVVETPWNETNEGINVGIDEYSRTTIQAANYLRKNLPGIKVSGGHFSTGTPYGLFQDYRAFSPAFDHLDYLSLHEYDFPQVDSGITEDATGNVAGYKVLRYRLMLGWAQNKNIVVPPIILSEFGYDAGGAGKGWKTSGSGITKYVDSLERVAKYLNEDIGNDSLLGAVLFCVGQEDDKDWGSFDLAGEKEFESLLNKEFANVVRPKEDSPADVQPDTEFSEWAGDDRNEHIPGTREYLNAFIAHREANSGVRSGTYGEQDALAGGFPKKMLDDIDRTEAKPTDPIHFTAKRLGVSPNRIDAIRQVESAGKSFGSPMKALIRFEAHLWLKRVSTDKKDWAKRNFRVVDGVEQIATHSSGYGWENLQNKDQDGRWNDLILAVAIDRENAFECTSMGLFQILGEHYKRLGYKSAEEMLKDFSQSEGVQWKGFEDFVDSDTGLYRALVSGDVKEFARLYNGIRNVNIYSPRLISAGW